MKKTKRVRKVKAVNMPTEAEMQARYNEAFKDSIKQYKDLCERFEELFGKEKD